MIQGQDPLSLLITLVVGGGLFKAISFIVDHFRHVHETEERADTLDLARWEALLERYAEREDRLSRIVEAQDVKIAMLTVKLEEYVSLVGALTGHLRGRRAGDGRGAS